MPCNHKDLNSEILRNRMPLTEAEITEIWMMIAMVHGGTAVEFVREVEKRHNIGA